MLWQPSLPEKYLSMSSADLCASITARRATLGTSLVILGHHYQTDEVIRHADFTGDSLKLSQLAAEIANGDAITRQNPAPNLSDAGPVQYVIFCGVHFMAETADMLTGGQLAVILPDLSAGCSMADMASYDDTLVAWETIHSCLNVAAGPTGKWAGRVIPITYVNSSAAIKAFVGQNGGACCTSSNAAAVFKWAMSQGGPGEEVKILFLPDQHLGRNTAAAFGIDVARHSCVYDPRLARRGEELGGATQEQIIDSKVILWAGHCSVHKLFRPEHCEQIRAAEASLPSTERTQILVHPECSKEVVDLADLTGSTEFIIQTINKAPAGSKWSVGTEVHLVNRLANVAKAKGVSVRILSDCQCLCTTMFRIDEPHILWVLDNLCGVFEKPSSALSQTPMPLAAPHEPARGRAKIVNQVSVLPEVRAGAMLALQRMLQLSNRAGVAVE